jgi:hypothetical protein
MSRLSRHIFLALAVIVTCGSCASEDSQSEQQFSTAQMESLIDSACESKFISALRTVHVAKACSVSSDCEFRRSDGIMVYEHCRMGNYVNPSAPELSGQSLAALEALEAELPACIGSGWQGLGCVGFSPTPATCWRGRCWVDVAQSGAAESVTPDQCASEAPAGTCTDCLCAHCPSDSANCFSDPDCRALFECTRATGALGRYAVLDFGAPTPPCQQLLAKSGGPQGAAAQAVENIWKCSIRRGCFGVCN